MDCMDELPARPVDPRHLTLLRELRERGLVSEVAAALHVTPSAVSQQLRSAEKDFGTALVEPVGRRLRLTAAGEVLADHATPVHEALERARAQVDRLRGELSGAVDLAALPSAAEYLVPRALVRLAETAPELTVRIHDRDVAEQDFGALCADHDLVLGHRAEVPTDPGVPASRRGGIRTRVLLREPLDVAVPAAGRWGRRRTVRPAEIADAAWIVPPVGFPFRTVLDAVEVAAARPVRVVQEVLDNRLVEALVVAGQGVALLPRLTTGPRAGLHLVEVSGVPTARQVLLLARDDRAERAAVAHVADTLAQAAAQASPVSAGRHSLPV